MIEWSRISFAISLLLWLSIPRSQAIAEDARSGKSVKGLNTTSILNDSPTSVPGAYGDETYGQINLVADLGADPTGQTDSTAAIQAFVLAVKNGFGGVVPPGTYSISSTINVVGRNSIRLAGLGGGVKGATIFRWDGASGGTVFSVNGVSDSYFEHFSVKGGSASVGVCFDVTNGTSDRFLDIGCEGPIIAGFQFSNTTGTNGFDRIDHFDIDCSGGDGIQILNSSSVGHDFVDGSIANCATGINATGGAFLSENLSFSSNQIDVHLGSQNGSTGLYTPQSVGAGQFLVVDPADTMPVKIEGGQIAAGTNQSVINDDGTGPLVLSNNWFISTAPVDSLQILVGSTAAAGSAVSIGNLYPGGFPVVGGASISSLGDVSASLAQLPVKLGATVTQTPTTTATATASATRTATATVSATFTSTATVTATSTTTPTPTATPTASATPTPIASPAPSLTLRPSVLRFGKTCVNKQSGPKTLRATNVGSVPISLGPAGATGDFRRSGGTCRSVLGKHAQCTYRLIFWPRAKGLDIGHFSVVDNKSGERQTVSLSGVGIQPVSSK